MHFNFLEAKKKIREEEAQKKKAKEKEEKGKKEVENKTKMAIGNMITKDET